MPWRSATRTSAGLVGIGVLSCRPMSTELELDTFAGRNGERFAFDAGDGAPVELELTEAEAVGELSVKQARELGKRVPFSLVFRGPAELDLPQATYTLRHAELGELVLFLVPIARDEGGSLFEAVFT